MKEPDHPDYLIPGTNMINLSKWSRENVPKDPPAHKVGDRVLVALCVTRAYKDCDGSPLFAVGQEGEESELRWLYGYSNESLIPAGTEPDDADADS